MQRFKDHLYVNAIETILVHQKVAPEFLPKLQEIFKNVQIYGDGKNKKNHRLSRSYWKKIMLQNMMIIFVI